jgi:hypothetical protein
VVLEAAENLSSATTAASAESVPLIAEAEVDMALCDRDVLLMVDVLVRVIVVVSSTLPAGTVKAWFGPKLINAGYWKLVYMAFDD